MATLTDIAAALGLNATTVSKALNDSSDISQETKKRVLAEAERVGYTRHMQKKLRKDTLNLIGIICPELTSQYYGAIVTSLNVCLQNKGYDTVVMISSFSLELEKHLLAQMVGINVAGVIIITESQNLAPIIKEIPGAQRIPTVIMGLNYESREHDVVSVAEEHGIRSMVSHLYQQGYRNYAFLGDALVHNRLNYLVKSLKNYEIEIPQENIILLNERNELCGIHGMELLLNHIAFPCAVLVGYDRIALGAYRLLSQRNIRIPEEVALAGFDDSNFCEFLPITITSLNYDVEGECRVAAAILVGKIRKESLLSTQMVEITPKLMIRESTQLQGGSLP